MGFKLDIGDFITFASIFVLVAGAVALVVFLMGLPGRIAIARKRPDAEAINMMGSIKAAWITKVAPTGNSASRCSFFSRNEDKKTLP